MQVPAARIYFPEEDRRRILEQIGGILETGQLTLGKYSREFEEGFARYVGNRGQSGNGYCCFFPGPRCTSTGAKHVGNRWAREK